MSKASSLLIFTSFDAIERSGYLHPIISSVFSSNLVRIDFSAALTSILTIFLRRPGSIIIYASKLNSGKKALVKMYLWTEEKGDQILTLEDLSESPGFRTIYAQINTLKELYEDMWIFYVLIDREVYKSIENPDRLINLTKNICNNSKEAILDEAIDMILPKLCKNPENKILVSEIFSIKQAAINKIKSGFIPSSKSTKERLDYIDFITLTLKVCINERENGI